LTNRVGPYPGGDQTNLNYGNPPINFMRAPGRRGTAFPDFSPGMSDGAGLISIYLMHRALFIPYCNNAGIMYRDDRKQYWYNPYNPGDGTKVIYRYESAFDPLWSPGYTPPTATPIGDPAMNVGTCDWAWLFTNMFNEDYGVMIDAKSNIWFTTNLTGSPPTWTHRGSPQVGTRYLSPRYQFCIPADPHLVFFTGVSGGLNPPGIALPCFTPDFGTTFVDISNYGTANALDTVMGLTAAADLDNSTIFVDYLKV
jgi:hypothetical protein